MASPSSFWRKIESVMDSETAFYVNTAIMVLCIVGIIAYAFMT